jgi:ribosome-associated translation inhibitor RaiA
MLDKAPQPFTDSSIFQSVAEARVMGSIQSEKYKSKGEQEKVHLEIWSIGAECMAEATLKLKNATVAEAADKHQQFITLFKDAGVLVEKDMSKTKWALEKLKQAYTPQTTH